MAVQAQALYSEIVNATRQLGATSEMEDFNFTHAVQPIVRILNDFQDPGVRRYVAAHANVHEQQAHCLMSLVTDQ